MKRLEGKRVLITGSSRGLGLAYARACMKEGAHVILHGRNEVKLKELSEDFTAQGYSVESVAFDLLDSSVAAERIAEIENTSGALDVLVNNAGLNKRVPFLEMSLQDWDTVLRANLYSTFILSQAAARYMVKRNRGKIINICSLLSESARPGIAAYTTSKGGLKMLTKAMAVELAPYNIQVNGLGPGYFVTDMNLPLKQDAKFDAWITGRTPMGRWGEVDELVGGLLFLAGAESDFVTGQILYIDGGILASL